MKNLALSAVVSFGMLFAFAVGLYIGEDISKGKPLCRRPVATVQPIQDSITLIGGDTATVWTSYDEGKTWYKVDWMTTQWFKHHRDGVESITAKSSNVALTPGTKVDKKEVDDTTSFLPMAFYGNDSLIRTTHHDALGWHPFDTLKCQKCYRRRNCWPLNKINNLDSMSEVIEYSR